MRHCPDCNGTGSLIIRHNPLIEVVHIECKGTGMIKPGITKPVEVETVDEARARIAALISTEIKQFQAQGLPNEMIGLKIFNALIDARLEIEELRKTATRLINELSMEIHNLVKESKESKSTRSS